MRRGLLALLVVASTLTTAPGEQRREAPKIDQAVSVMDDFLPPRPRPQIAVTKPASRPQLARTRRAARSKPSTPPKSFESLLACIAHYESGGDYGAVSRSGKYRNGYQMDRSFWLTYGGNPLLAGKADDPSTWKWEQASPSEQDRVALAGIAARGLSPWPTPNRKCR